MKIYLMRHGQTDWNIEGKVQGKTNTKLNETGINQAEMAKEEINRFDIDLILCSPLDRAVTTAQIINSDKNVPIIIEKRLEERNFGNYEGIKASENPEYAKSDFWNYNKNTNLENMETIVDLCDRVWGFLDEIKTKYKGKNILMVTHGGTSRAVVAYFTGLDEDGRVPSVKMGNCEIREFEIN